MGPGVVDIFGENAGCYAFRGAALREAGRSRAVVHAITSRRKMKARIEVNRGFCGFEEDCGDGEEAIIRLTRPEASAGLHTGAPIRYAVFVLRTTPR